MSAAVSPTSCLSIDELRAVYEISRIILRHTDTSTALQEIIQLARPVFIFDNAVIYQRREDGLLEPTYARSVGRGRSTEADMAWGEAIAQEVIKTGDQVVRQEETEGSVSDPMMDRLRFRFYLGLPLQVNQENAGALIFIRFGGPPYLPEQIHIAELIAEHIAQLLEKKDLINQIARLETERRLDRLQEDFVATISHDLRSPLGFIKGYTTSLLRDDVEWDSATRQEFLTIIDEEADRLAELIDNLLDSARLQSGTLKMEFQQLQLDALLADLVQRAKARSYSLNIQVDFDPSHERISGDPHRLMQVFENLLTNAEKYAPGSEVTVGVRWQPDNVQVWISDTGPGIPQEHLDDIFKRFYRVPQSETAEQGTGLGLYICQEIIQAHQGTIWAESHLGEGTTIHIVLPRPLPDQAIQEIES